MKRLYGVVGLVVLAVLLLALLLVDWSPSQRRLWLWVMRPDRSAEIASIDVATGSIEVLKTLEWRSHSQGPSLSPDGRFVAYHDADQRDAPPDLFLLATDGGSEVRVEHPASDSKPLFTPDGTGLVFVSDRRPGFKDLWFLPVSEGRPAGPARIVWEDLDLLGTAMRFGKNGSLFYYFATNAWDVHTVDIDVSQRIVGTPKLLEPLSGEMNTAPAFSPDGSFLAHLRGGRRLVIRELATGREREFPVPRLVTSGTSLNWCTGGTSMIVTGFQSELTSFRVDLERGGAQHLDLEDPWRVQCLGSAEEVVYIRSVKKAGDLDTNHIVRRSLTSGEETILYEGKVDLLGCSADGAQISFVEKDETEGRLFVMSSSGGDPVTIAVSPTYPWMGRRWSEFRGAMWTSDGEALIVVRGGRMEGADAPSPEVTLWRYPLDGGEPTEVGAMQVPSTETGFVGTLNYSLHPDESSIAFERHVGFVAQVWAMDELLPFIQSGEHVQLASPHR